MCSHSYPLVYISMDYLQWFTWAEMRLDQKFGWCTFHKHLTDFLLLIFSALKRHDLHQTHWALLLLRQLWLQSNWGKKTHLFQYIAISCIKNTHTPEASSKCEAASVLGYRAGHYNILSWDLSNFFRTVWTHHWTPSLLVSQHACILHWK